MLQPYLRVAQYIFLLTIENKFQFALILYSIPLVAMRMCFFLVIHHNYQTISLNVDTFCIQEKQKPTVSHLIHNREHQYDA